ncbi:hypothetical protein FKM82_000416 [Ascaphus truei]
MLLSGTHWVFKCSCSIFTSLAVWILSSCRTRCFSSAFTCFSLASCRLAHSSCSCLYSMFSAYVQHPLCILKCCLPVHLTFPGSIVSSPLLIHGIFYLLQ